MPSELNINKEEFQGPFSLSRTIECEQCPTDIWFTRGENEYYTYYKLNQKWVKPFMVQKNGDLNVMVADEAISENELRQIKNFILDQFWHEYDFPDFYAKFSSDPYMSKLIETCQGLRVMRDWDLQWRFIEGICTQNASVNRIRNMDRAIRTAFGKRVFPNEDFYSFPNLQDLAKVSEEELKKKGKVGYRAEYIKEAAQRVVDRKINLIELKDKSTDEARRFYVKLKGSDLKSLI